MKNFSLTKKSPRRQRARKSFCLSCIFTHYVLDSRPVKIRTELGATVRPEVAMRPRERTALIREAIESTLNRQKELDHHWEDQVDVNSLIMTSVVLLTTVCLEPVSTPPSALLQPSLQICCTCHFFNFGVEWRCCCATTGCPIASWPWRTHARR